MSNTDALDPSTKGCHYIIFNSHVFINYSDLTFWVSQFRLFQVLGLMGKDLERKIDLKSECCCIEGKFYKQMLK